MPWGTELGSWRYHAPTGQGQVLVLVAPPALRITDRRATTSRTLSVVRFALVRTWRRKRLAPTPERWASVVFPARDIAPAPVSARPGALLRLFVHWLHERGAGRGGKK